MQIICRIYCFVCHRHHHSSLILFAIYQLPFIASFGGGVISEGDELTNPSPSKITPLTFPLVVCCSSKPYNELQPSRSLHFSLTIFINIIITCIYGTVNAVTQQHSRFQQCSAEQSKQQNVTTTTDLLVGLLSPY